QEQRLWPGGRTLLDGGDDGGEVDYRAEGAARVSNVIGPIGRLGAARHRCPRIRGVYTGTSRPLRRLRCASKRRIADDPGQTFRFIHTAFGSVKFSIAAVPCSRPSPESRSPPQGRRTSV